MKMEKNIRLGARILMAVGLLMVIFGFVCAISADKGIGSLEDAYYYLGINMYHGRFDASEAGDIIEMMDDIGISDSLLTGFQRYAIRAQSPLFLIGLLITIIGAVGAFAKDIYLPEEMPDSVRRVQEKLRMYASAAVEWIKLRCSARVCLVCGAKLMKGATFCGNCGAALAAEESAAEEPACAAESDKETDTCAAESAEEAEAVAAESVEEAEICATKSDKEAEACGESPVKEE